MIQQTSLEVWNELKKKPEKLGKMQQKIYDLFKKHDVLYDLEVSLLLNLPINCVTPRRNELEKANLIYKKGNQYSKYTHKLVNIYSIV